MFRRSANASPDPANDSLDNPSNDQDIRLIAAAAHGDLDSFNALVSKHERAVFNLCWRMLGSVPEAEDASQESFIKAWKNAGTFKGGTFRPWLLKIASNTCYDQMRTRQRRPTDSLDTKQFEKEPEWSSQAGIVEPVRFAEIAELGALIQSLLLQLPDEQRLAVTLCDIQDIPLIDAATVMGTSVGTLKSRLFRGRSKLRDLMLADELGRELLGESGRSTNEKA